MEKNTIFPIDSVWIQATWLSFRSALLCENKQVNKAKEINKKYGQPVPRIQ